MSDGMHSTRHEARGHRLTEWWQFSDGHWDGEKAEDTEDTGSCLPAGWGTVELRRTPDTAVSSNDENCEETCPQTYTNLTEAVHFNNIPIAQFSGDGPDWGGGRARITGAACGEVIIEPDDGRYIGAAAHTNNTGELTGMYEMLGRAMTRPAGAGRELLCTDSLYAKHMTTGHWTPRVRRNADMISLLRRMWRKLRRGRPGEVDIVHVRSHTVVLGNDIADWLAERGSMDAGVTPTQMTTWLDQWKAARRASEQQRRGDGVTTGEQSQHLHPRQGDG